jgi:5'-methylthioinosine phosphorylase
MLAVIGGSGLTRLPGFESSGEHTVSTPYGAPSAPLVSGTLGGARMVFLARHGNSHSIAPHDINYRANIWALKNEGVSRILSVATVGGIGERFPPGALVVPHQLIDYTWGRAHTFFDDGEPVTHVDFTEPYSEDIRSALLWAAGASGEPVVADAVYAVTQGPRLESAAEINRLERDGADIVGMTAMPEAVLAREKGIGYGALAVVANYAAGRGDSRNRIDLEAIHAVHGEAMLRVVRILAKVAEKFQ